MLPLRCSAFRQGAGVVHQFFASVAQHHGSGTYIGDDGRHVDNHGLKVPAKITQRLDAGITAGGQVPA